MHTHKDKEQYTLQEWFGALRSDYEAIRNSRYKRDIRGLPSRGSTADFHYRYEGDFFKLAEVARHFMMNDPIVRQGVNRLVANVVQCGFTPEPQTGSLDADRILRQRWADYAIDPDQVDASGRMAFSQLEQLYFKQIIVDGDIFPIRMNNGKIRTYEFHRCRTPKRTQRNVVHGILLDEFRRPKEYWFTKEDIGINQAVTRVGDMNRVPARDTRGNKRVFHLYFPDRVTQTRGVTALAPISDMVGMFDDIQFAKLVQAQTVSAYAFIREHDLDSLSAGGGTVGIDTEDETVDGFNRTFEIQAPGQMLNASPGERITGFSPNVPNAEYFDHAMLILTIIAVNLDLPVNALLLDASNTNFSGFRGALDQSRMRYVAFQDSYANQFHRPVWQWKVRNWITSDPDLRTLAANSDVDLFRHVWHPPKWDYIEPNKDAQADVLTVKSNINSPRRVQSARGRRWAEIAKEIVEDNVMLIEQAIEAANELNGRYPNNEQQVSWREVASLPLPEGMTLKIEDKEEIQPHDNATKSV